MRHTLREWVQTYREPAIIYQRPNGSLDWCLVGSPAWFGVEPAWIIEVVNGRTELGESNGETCCVPCADQLWVGESFPNSEVKEISSPKVDDKQVRQRKEQNMNLNGTWDVYWWTPEGSREILRANVSRATAFAWRAVFAWCYVELVAEREKEESQ